MFISQEEIKMGSGFYAERVGKCSYYRNDIPCYEPAKHIVAVLVAPGTVWALGACEVCILNLRGFAKDRILEEEGYAERAWINYDRV